MRLDILLSDSLFPLKPTSDNVACRENFLERIQMLPTVTCLSSNVLAINNLAQKTNCFKTCVVLQTPLVNITF